VQARTAYQIVYCRRHHHGRYRHGPRHPFAVFGRGVEEPYFPEAEARVAQALQKANSIVVTHEHRRPHRRAVRSEHFSELAPKTVLTRAQLETLINEPQMPELRPTLRDGSRLAG